jgi:hypothetical protein
MPVYHQWIVGDSDRVDVGDDEITVPQLQSRRSASTWQRVDEGISKIRLIRVPAPQWCVP